MHLCVCVPDYVTLSDIVHCDACRSYNCPVYKTRMRPKGALGHPDGGYVFTAGLKTKVCKPSACTQRAEYSTVHAHCAETENTWRCCFCDCHLQDGEAKWAMAGVALLTDIS